jgi:monofunctional biosynthetic peptidoglycan transglycosylase
MIEIIWGKERILEMYLNVSEMGQGIYGIEAAAQKYFKKPALKLSQTEAARIVAALPNPKKYKVSPASKYVSDRSQWILTQMNNLQSDPDIKLLIERKKSNQQGKK